MCDLKSPWRLVLYVLGKIRQVWSPSLNKVVDFKIFLLLYPSKKKQKCSRFLSTCDNLIYQQHWDSFSHLLLLAWVKNKSLRQWNCWRIGMIFDFDGLKCLTLGVSVICHYSNLQVNFLRYTGIFSGVLGFLRFTGILSDILAFLQMYWDFLKIRIYWNIVKPVLLALKIEVSRSI